MSLIDHLKLNDEDYNKNFVLLDVDETLIYGGNLNRVLCDMLKENKDNSNFFLFTRMSIETVQLLQPLNNNTKKNTFRNFLRAKLKNEYQIDIKAVITPFDAFDEMFIDERGVQEVHIPGDYYKDKIEQFDVVAYKNNTQRQMTQKMETLFQKENGKDIQLKVDMFIQLVDYILKNKPVSITKRPTFIFFDDTVSQLFSVGLVGFSMSDKINLFIQNPLRKDSDRKQAEFISKEMYKFSYNSKEYNNPFHFCNDTNLTNNDFLSKLVINLSNLLNTSNNNGIILKKSDNDLERILNYNKNGINLKSILFKFIKEILSIQPQNLPHPFQNELPFYKDVIFDCLEEILKKEDFDIIKRSIEPPRTIATLNFEEKNGTINYEKVILTKINNDVIELKKNYCISFDYSDEENIIVKIKDFYHSGGYNIRISYSIWVTDDICCNDKCDLIQQYQLESIQLVECPELSAINTPSLSLNSLSLEQIKLLTQKQIWSYMNEIKNLTLEKIKELIDNVKNKIVKKIIKKYYEIKKKKKKKKLKKKKKKRRN